MTTRVPALSTFPPGILPIIGAYANAEGETHWECGIPNLVKVEQIKMDPVSGQLLLSVERQLYLIRIYPNGSLNFIHQTWPHPTYRDVCPAAITFVKDGTCMIQDADTIYKVEWQGARYTPQLTKRYVPFHTSLSAFVMDENYIYVMDENYIYVMDAFGFLQCVARNSGGRDRILFEAPPTKRMYSKLTWCGPTHLLFALEEKNQDKKPSLSIYRIHIDTGCHQCLVTDIPVSNTFTLNGADELDFCVAPGLARGSSLLIRSLSEFRTVSLSIV